MRIVVKCLNRLRNKYRALNNNDSAGKKMLGWLDFEGTCKEWVNTIFKIVFESMFVEVAQA